MRDMTIMDRLLEETRTDTRTEDATESAAPPAGKRSAVIPELRMEGFFLGATRGHGVFQDRFGTLRQQFTVDMFGHWQGDRFLLEEHFRYRDGTTSDRLWQVRVIDDLHYEATADDIVGVAGGVRDGSTIRWRYVLAVPIGGRLINMRFDDRMFLQDDGVLINVSDARKWGLRLGRLAASFQARR